MNINPEIITLVKKIDNHVNTFPETDKGLEHLMISLYDYMESFKMIMDSTSKDEIDYLSQQYGGFYRFAKVLEMLATGISEGAINVPADH